MKKKVCILSIDGGGIRGLIPAIISAEIEKRLQLKTGDSNVTLSDYFDMIAGTSTGGILTCFYLLPPEPTQTQHSKFYAADAIPLYANHGKEIFQKKGFNPFGIFSEAYSAKGLEKILKEKMGDAKLSDSKKHCLITAYDVNLCKAVLFTYPEAKEKDSRNYYMRDIARATAAAPTYFELADIQSFDETHSYLIDGGMYAGNPVLCAIVEARKTVFDKCNHPEIPDLYVVSLGTGKSAKHYDPEKAKKWGLAGWARPVVDIMMSSSSEVVHYQVKQLFDVAECTSCYNRLEIDLGTKTSEMDDVSKGNIARLQQVSADFCKNNSALLDKIVDDLIANQILEPATAPQTSSEFVA